MPRKPRVEYAGAVYHVMSRGNHSQKVFRTDGDCEVFLATLGEVCVRMGWQVHAYALMGNNFSLMTIRIAGMFTGDVVQQVELGSAMSTVLALLMCVSVVINMKYMGKAGELRK